MPDRVDWPVKLLALVIGYNYGPEVFLVRSHGQEKLLEQHVILCVIMSLSAWAFSLAPVFDGDNDVMPTDGHVWGKERKGPSGCRAAWLATDIESNTMTNGVPENLTHVLTQTLKHSALVLSDVGRYLRWGVPEHSHLCPTLMFNGSTPHSIITSVKNLLIIIVSDLGLDSFWIMEDLHYSMI